MEDVGELERETDEGVDGAIGEERAANGGR